MKCVTYTDPNNNIKPVTLQALAAFDSLVEMGTKSNDVYKAAKALEQHSINTINDAISMIKAAGGSPFELTMFTGNSTRRKIISKADFLANPEKFLPMMFAFDSQNLAEDIKNYHSAPITKKKEMLMKWLTEPRGSQELPPYVPDRAQAAAFVDAMFDYMQAKNLVKQIEKGAKSSKGVFPIKQVLEALKTIDTPYPLSLEQRTAIIESLRNIWYGNNTFLQGYAGTGKTTGVVNVVIQLATNMMGSKVGLTAPTPVSLASAERATGLKGIDLDSMTAVQLQAELEKHNLIVFDEATLMLTNSAKFSEAYAAAKANGKAPVILFTGDVNQIASPVPISNEQIITTMNPVLFPGALFAEVEGSSANAELAKTTTVNGKVPASFVTLMNDVKFTSPLTISYRSDNASIVKAQLDWVNGNKAETSYSFDKASDSGVTTFDGGVDIESLKTNNGRTKLVIVPERSMIQPMVDKLLAAGVTGVDVLDPVSAQSTTYDEVHIAINAKQNGALYNTVKAYMYVAMSRAKTKLVLDPSIIPNAKIITTNNRSVDLTKYSAGIKNRTAADVERELTAEIEAADSIQSDINNLPNDAFLDLPEPDTEITNNPAPAPQVPDGTEEQDGDTDDDQGQGTPGDESADTGDKEKEPEDNEDDDDSDLEDPGTSTTPSDGDKFIPPKGKFNPPLEEGFEWVSDGQNYEAQYDGLKLVLPASAQWDGTAYRVTLKTAGTSDVFDAMVARVMIDGQPKFVVIAIAKTPPVGTPITTKFSLRGGTSFAPNTNPVLDLTDADINDGTHSKTFATSVNLFRLNYKEVKNSNTRDNIRKVAAKINPAKHADKAFNNSIVFINRATVDQLEDFIGDTSMIPKYLYNPTMLGRTIIAIPRYNDAGSITSYHFTVISPKQFNTESSADSNTYKHLDRGNQVINAITKHPVYATIKKNVPSGVKLGDREFTTNDLLYQAVTGSLPSLAEAVSKQGGDMSALAPYIELYEATAALDRGVFKPKKIVGVGMRRLYEAGMDFDNVKDSTVDQDVDDFVFTGTKTRLDGGDVHDDKGVKLGKLTTFSSKKGNNFSIRRVLVIGSAQVVIDTPVEFNFAPDKEAELVQVLQEYSEWIKQRIAGTIPPTQTYNLVAALNRVGARVVPDYTKKVTVTVHDHAQVIANKGRYYSKDKRTQRAAFSIDVPMIEGSQVNDMLMQSIKGKIVDNLKNKEGFGKSGLSPYDEALRELGRMNQKVYDKAGNEFVLRREEERAYEASGITRSIETFPKVSDSIDQLESLVDLTDGIAKVPTLVSNPRFAELDRPKAMSSLGNQSLLDEAYRFDIDGDNPTIPTSVTFGSKRPVTLAADPVPPVTNPKPTDDDKGDVKPPITDTSKPVDDTPVIDTSDPDKGPESDSTPVANPDDGNGPLMESLSTEQLVDAAITEVKALIAAGRKLTPHDPTPSVQYVQELIKRLTGTQHESFVAQLTKFTDPNTVKATPAILLSTLMQIQQALKVAPIVAPTPTVETPAKPVSKPRTRKDKPAKIERAILELNKNNMGVSTLVGYSKDIPPYVIEMIERVRHLLNIGHIPMMIFSHGHKDMSMLNNPNGVTPPVEVEDFFNETFRKITPNHLGFVRKLYNREKGVLASAFYINPDMFKPNARKKDIIDTIFHELGHVVDYEHVLLNKDISEKIDQAYQDDMDKVIDEVGKKHITGSLAQAAYRYHSYAYSTSYFGKRLLSPGPKVQEIKDKLLTILNGGVPFKGNQMEKDGALKAALLMAAKLAPQLEDLTELTYIINNISEAGLETYKDLIDESLRTLESYADLFKNVTGLKATKLLKSVADEYYISRAEWAAHQTAKWGMSSELPLTIVERFFKRLADFLYKLFQVKRRYLPNETWKEFLEKHVISAESAAYAQKSFDDYVKSTEAPVPVKTDEPEVKRPATLSDDKPARTKPKPTKTDKPKPVKGVDKDRTKGRRLDATSEVNSLPISLTTKTTAEMVKFIRKYIPGFSAADLKALTPEQMEKLLNSKTVFGFYEDGTINVKENPDGTLNLEVTKHEVFHLLFDVYFTNEERRALINAVKEEYSDPNMSDLVAEELLATMFQRMDKEGPLKIMWNKVVSFVKWVLGLKKYSYGLEKMIQDIHNKKYYVSMRENDGASRKFLDGIFHYYPATATKSSVQQYRESLHGLDVLARFRDRQDKYTTEAAIESYDSASAWTPYSDTAGAFMFSNAELLSFITNVITDDKGKLNEAKMTEVISAIQLATMSYGVVIPFDTDSEGRYVITQGKVEELILDIRNKIPNNEINSVINSLQEYCSDYGVEIVAGMFIGEFESSVIAHTIKWNTTKPLYLLNELWVEKFAKKDVLTEVETIKGPTGLQNETLEADQIDWYNKASAVVKSLIGDVSAKVNGQVVQVSPGYAYMQVFQIIEKVNWSGVDQLAKEDPVKAYKYLSTQLTRAIKQVKAQTPTSTMYDAVADKLVNTIKEAYSPLLHKGINKTVKFKFDSNGNFKLYIASPTHWYFGNKVNTDLSKDDYLLKDKQVAVITKEDLPIRDRDWSTAIDVLYAKAKADTGKLKVFVTGIEQIAAKNYEAEFGQKITEEDLEYAVKAEMYRTLLAAFVRDKHKHALATIVTDLGTQYRNEPVNLIENNGGIQRAKAVRESMNDALAKDIKYSLVNYLKNDYERDTFPQEYADNQNDVVAKWNQLSEVLATPFKSYDEDKDRISVMFTIIGLSVPSRVYNKDNAMTEINKIRSTLFNTIFGKASGAESVLDHITYVEDGKNKIDSSPSKLRKELYNNQNKRISSIVDIVTKLGFRIADKDLPTNFKDPAGRNKYLNMKSDNMLDTLRAIELRLNNPEKLDTLSIRKSPIGQTNLFLADEGFVPITSIDRVEGFVGAANSEGNNKITLLRQERRVQSMKRMYVAGFLSKVVDALKWDNTRSIGDISMLPYVLSNKPKTYYINTDISTVSKATITKQVEKFIERYDTLYKNYFNFLNDGVILINGYHNIDYSDFNNLKDGNLSILDKLSPEQLARFKANGRVMYTLPNGKNLWIEKSRVKYGNAMPMLKQHPLYHRKAGETTKQAADRIVKELFDKGLAQAKEHSSTIESSMQDANGNNMFERVDFDNIATGLEKVLGFKYDDMNQQPNDYIYASWYVGQYVMGQALNETFIGDPTLWYKNADDIIKRMSLMSAQKTRSWKEGNYLAVVLEDAQTKFTEEADRLGLFNEINGSKISRADAQAFHIKPFEDFMKESMGSGYVVAPNVWKPVYGAVDQFGAALSEKTSSRNITDDLAELSPMLADVRSSMYREPEMYAILYDVMKLGAATDFQAKARTAERLLKTKGVKLPNKKIAYISKLREKANLRNNINKLIQVLQKQGFEFTEEQLEQLRYLYEHPVMTVIYESGVKAATPANKAPQDKSDQDNTNIKPVTGSIDSHVFASAAVRYNYKDFGFQQVSEHEEVVDSVAEVSQLMYYTNTNGINRELANMLYKATAAINDINFILFKKEGIFDFELDNDGNVIKESIKVNEVKLRRKLIDSLKDVAGSEAIAAMLSAGVDFNHPVLADRIFIQLSNMVKKNVLLDRYAGDQMVLQTDTGVQTVITKDGKLRRKDTKKFFNSMENLVFAKGDITNFNDKYYSLVNSMIAASTLVYRVGLENAKNTSKWAKFVAKAAEYDIDLNTYDFNTVPRDLQMVSYDLSDSDPNKSDAELIYEMNKDQAYTEVIMSRRWLKTLGTKFGYDYNPAINDFVAIRIPTTGTHSAVVLKVVGFLDDDKDAGTNIVIAPKELVAIHGSDFDIDKLFVIRRHLLESKSIKGAMIGVTKNKYGQQRYLPKLDDKGNFTAEALYWEDTVPGYPVTEYTNTGITELPVKDKTTGARKIAKIKDVIRRVPVKPHFEEPADIQAHYEKVLEEHDKNMYVNGEHIEDVYLRLKAEADEAKAKYIEDIKAQALAQGTELTGRQIVKALRKIKEYGEYEAKYRNIKKYRDAMYRIKAMILANMKVDAFIYMMSDTKERRVEGYETHDSNLRYKLKPIDMDIIRTAIVDAQINAIETAKAEGRATDAEIDLLSKLKQQLAENVAPNKIMELFKTKQDINDPIAQADYVASNHGGALLTGIWANLTKYFAYVRFAAKDESNYGPGLIDIVTKSKNGEETTTDLKLLQFKLAGANYGNISRFFKDAEGDRLEDADVWFYMDGLINAAIDNVKEQILPLLNANEDVATVIALLTVLGVPFDKIAAIARNKYIAESFQTSIQAVKAKYSKEFENNENTKYDEAVGITQQDLDAGLLENGEPDKAYKVFLFVADKLLPYKNAINTGVTGLSILKDAPVRSPEVRAVRDAAYTFANNDVFDTDISKLPHFNSANRTIDAIKQLAGATLLKDNQDLSRMIEDLVIFNFGKADAGNRKFGVYERAEAVKKEFFAFLFNETILEDVGETETVQGRTSEFFIKNSELEVQKLVRKIIARKAELRAGNVAQDNPDAITEGFTDYSGNLFLAHLTGPVGSGPLGLNRLGWSLTQKGNIENMVKADFLALPKDLQEDLMRYSTLVFGSQFGYKSFTKFMDEELVSKFSQEVVAKRSAKVKELLENEPDKVRLLVDIFAVQLSNMKPEWLGTAKDTRVEAIVRKKGEGPGAFKALVKQDSLLNEISDTEAEISMPIGEVRSIYGLDKDQPVTLGTLKFLMLTNKEDYSDEFGLDLGVEAVDMDPDDGGNAASDEDTQINAIETNINKAWYVRDVRTIKQEGSEDKVVIKLVRKPTRMTTYKMNNELFDIFTGEYDQALDFINSDRVEDIIFVKDEVNLATRKIMQALGDNLAKEFAKFVVDNIDTLHKYHPMYAVLEGLVKKGVITAKLLEDLISSDSKDKAKAQKKLKKRLSLDGKSAVISFSNSTFAELALKHYGMYYKLLYDATAYAMMTNRISSSSGLTKALIEGVLKDIETFKAEKVALVRPYKALIKGKSSDYFVYKVLSSIAEGERSADNILDKYTDFMNRLNEHLENC